MAPLQIRRTVLLGVTTLVCTCGAPDTSVPPETLIPMTDPSRQRVLDFWRIYREATKMRVGGDVAAALARYDSALTLNPEHGDALYHAGSAAFQLGDFAGAEARWRHLLAVDGSNGRAHVQLGVLYSCGLPGAPVDLHHARQQLERALALNRAETGPQVRLGEVALLQGDEVAARRYFDGARMTNERSGAAHYLSGYLRWRAGQFDDAGDALRLAVAAVAGTQDEASASAEGQTRRGFRPLLETGHEGPLAPHWQNTVLTLGQVTDAVVQSEYGRFHDILGPLRLEFSPRESTRNEDE